MKDVPYIVYEGELARAERHIKRLHIQLCLSLILAGGSAFNYSNIATR